MKSRLSVRISIVVILVALSVISASIIPANAESTRNITPSDPVAYARFGGAVAVYTGSTFDEYYAIAGAEGNGTGAAYIFKYDGNNWKQSAKLAPVDGSASDKFGCSVAISKNSSGEYYAIVGAYEADKGTLDVGTAYIFKLGTGGWTQQARLTASDYTPGDKFGYSVSLSGDYAVIGAYGDDDKGDWAGSAYIFKREGTSWTQKQKIFAADSATGDSFGETVSVFGDYAIVGSAWSDVSNNNSSGAAYIFKRNTTTDQWLQEKKLTQAQADLAAGDNFGSSVSVFNDGTDWYAAVGSVKDDDKGTDSGSVYIFKKESTVWNQKAKLTATDGVKNDNFGKAVFISGGKSGADKYVIVGANKTDTTDSKGNAILDVGSAYIFKGKDSSWSQIKEIVSETPAAYDYLGCSVALWYHQDSGNYSSIAGALGRDVSLSGSTLTDAGAAMIFSTASTDMPVISDIPDQRTRKDTATSYIYFTVTAPGTTSTTLEVSAASGNTTLVPSANIKINGSSSPYTPTLVNNTATLYLVLTPASNKSGDAKITVFVKDKNTAKSSAEEFTLTVTSAPTITLQFNEKVTSEATPVTCAVSLNDENTSAVLTVSATSNNTTIIPNANVVLTGSGKSWSLKATPVPGKFGKAAITVTVSNGLEQSSANLVIIVSGGPPVISSIPDQIVDEDKSVSVSVTVEDKDTASSDIKLSAVSDNTEIVPSAGIVSSALSGTSGTLTITPAQNKNGTVTITVTASDGVESSLPKSFSLTVNPVNDSPTLSDIAAQTTTEDNAKINIPITVGDIDGDNLTLNAVSSNKTLVPDSNISVNGYVATDYNIPSTVYSAGTPLNMKIIPATDVSGNALITVTISDGNSEAVKSFLFSVNSSNDPPTISLTENQAGMTTNEDTASSKISFNVADLDSDVLTITGKSGNPTLVKDSNISINGSSGSYKADPSVYSSGSLGIIITPESGQDGTALITVTVSDGTLSASASFTLTVKNVPKPPTVQTIASQTIQEDTLITNAAAITVIVNDPDGDLLTVTAKATDTTLISTSNIYINDSPGGIVYVSQEKYSNINMKLVPETDKNGTTIIEVTVNDGSTSVKTSFVVTVTPVNDSPTISGTPPTTVNEDELYSFTPTAADIDNALNTLTFSVTNNPIWLTIDSKTGKLSGTPTNKNVGIVTGIIITVKDPNNPSASASLPAFNITVLNVNDAPVISSIPAQTANEDNATSAISFTVTDAEGGKLTVTVTSLNTTLIPQDDEHIRLNGMGQSYLVNASAETAVNLSLILVPAKDKNGTAEIIVTADDGSGSATAVATKSFILNVTPGNDPPVIDGIPGTTTDVDDIPAQTTKESTATSAISFSVSDKEGGVLQITSLSDNTTLVSNANIKITGTDSSGYISLPINGSAALKMTITPETGKYGTAKITVSAKDATDTVSSSFVLTVTSVNDAPVISTIAAQTTDEETAISVDVTVKDTEGGIMTLSVVSPNTTTCSD